MSDVSTIGDGSRRVNDISEPVADSVHPTLEELARGAAYGRAREAVPTGNVLHVSLTPEALADLRLDDGEIEAVVEAPAEDVVQCAESSLRQVELVVRAAGQRGTADPSAIAQNGVDGVDGVDGVTRRPLPVGWPCPGRAL
ncbi:hypothetical protein ACFCYH_35070 [Streptomyces sp. NPDC056400]|uniref:hypothetical protein n=1 Tax=Streptomyces sp. NPDC056400 TaxID=3345808 RepID=UPI0035DCB426